MFKYKKLLWWKHNTREKPKKLIEKTYIADVNEEIWQKDAQKHNERQKEWKIPKGNMETEKNELNYEIKTKKLRWKDDVQMETSILCLLMENPLLMLNNQDVKKKGK